MGEREEAMERVAALLAEAEAIASLHEIAFAAALAHTRTAHASYWTRACHGHGPGMATVAGAVRGLTRSLPDEVSPEVDGAR
jgi:hypothetical protein